MTKVSLDDLLAQADSEEVGGAFESFMRTAARNAFVTVLFDEVKQLCGPAYSRHENTSHERAGSAPGRYLLGTEECKVRRPRVRKDGSEIRLKSYEAAQNREQLQEAMMRAFMAGLSSREQKRLFEDSSGTRRSEVSRLWQK